MKKVVIVNASPRTTWNTATLLKEAAKGAENSGAQVKYFDLYRLPKFTGCVSCFGCKLGENKGKCVYKDGLSEVLEEIRSCDALIMGTPNYFGDVTAAFRALFERLCFQYHSYKIEPHNYNERKIPILLVMTSNVPKEMYDKTGYDKVLENYQRILGGMIGNTKTFACGNTLQVSDYPKYDWTMFNVESKYKQHEEVFPKEKEEIYKLGEEIITKPW